MEEEINIIYLRVSKEEEKEQDLEAQLPPILERFNVGKYFLYKERGSAYDLNKFHKRKEFIKILEKCFDASNTTIKDLFMQKKIRVRINLYVWDYARIMRNFEFNLLFGLLCDLCNVTVYSYKDGQRKKSQDETPTEKLARYLLYSISAFGAEDYSYQTSQNIKKSITKEQGITYSNKGNKWGSQFRDKNGKIVSMPRENITLLNKRICAIERYHKKQYGKSDYPKIIKKIEKEWDIKISKAYISILLSNS